MEYKDIKKAVLGLLNGKPSVELDDSKVDADLLKSIKRADVRLKLVTEDKIVPEFPGGGKLILRVIGAPVSDSAGSNPEKAKAAKAKSVCFRDNKRHEHSYRPPKVAIDVVSMLSDDASHIVWLTGPTQCGKTMLVKYVGESMDRQVYKINCRGDMGSEAFFGDRSVVIDEKTGQNITSYVPGIVEKAMTHGLDDDGNEVGDPAILFVDEIATLPAEIAIGLNGLFESDNPRRSITLDLDGGRVVRSHSKFRIIVAANNAGRGASGLHDSLYEAQADALDISLLHRISACVRMGYDRAVEKGILMEKIGDDRVVSDILKFRDKVRAAIRQGSISSPFSTGNIVKIADMYRIFGDIGKALYYSTFEFLLEEERAVYNETAKLVLGRDLVQEHFQDGIDYM